MNPRALETVSIALDFGKPPGGRHLLDRMSHAPGLAMNIVRGRVTAAEARYEIRLRGSRRSVARALRLCGGARSSEAAC